MNDTLKTLIISFAKTAADRGAIALGVALLSHGILVPAQLSGFDQIVSGLIMLALGAAVAWYREHGKALLQAEVTKLNAQVDALTKTIVASTQAATGNGKIIVEHIGAGPQTKN